MIKPESRGRLERERPFTFQDFIWDFNGSKQGETADRSRGVQVQYRTKSEGSGKFDEAVRVKQQEKERQSEEEHAAEAVEEEREIREMRRRAVPKANAVPEWYAAMPKRKTA